MGRPSSLDERNPVSSPMPRFDVTVAGEVNLDLILYGVPEELPRERELLADWMMLTLGRIVRNSGARSRCSGQPCGFSVAHRRREFRRDRTTPPATKWGKCFARTAHAQRSEDGHYCHFAARAMAQHGDLCGNNRRARVG